MTPVIEDIVSKLPGTPVFVTGDKGYANLISDDLEFANGAVYLFTPLTYTGITQKNYKLLMFFGIKNEFEDFPIHTRPLLDQMGALSDQFLFRLQKYEDEAFRTVTREIKNVKRTEVENEYDVNLCGIILEFELLPFNYMPDCII